MRIIINISIVLIILLSATVCAAKPKKPAAEPKKQSAAESKKAMAEPNKPAVEPNKPAAEPNAAASKAISVKDANSEAVAVTVNGAAITEGQIEAILNPQMQQMAGRVPPNMVSQYRQQIRKRIIDQLVVEKLLAQKEKQNNIDVNQSEMDRQINKQIAEQNLTIDEFKSLLKAYGTSFTNYQQDVRKRLMFEKLIETEFAQKLQKPTVEQAKTYYNENLQQFIEPEKIHAKHILIKPEDGNDPNQAKLQAKAKAQEILEKVKAGGDFEELAKQYSGCPSGKNGGELGMQPKGTFVPEFEKAAYALKPGQVSDIVETNFGFHIIKLIEHTDANTLSFEQAKEKIIQTLTDKQKERIVVDYIQKMKTEADIKFANEADKVEINPEKTARPSRRAEQNQQSSDNNSPKKD